MKFNLLRTTPFIIILAFAFIAAAIAGPYGLFQDAIRILDGLFQAARSNLLIAVGIGAVFSAFIYIRYFLPLSRSLGEAISKSYVELLFTGGLMFMAVKAFTMEGAKGPMLNILMLYGALSLVFAGIFVEKLMQFTLLVATAMKAESETEEKPSRLPKAAMLGAYGLGIIAVALFAALILSRLFVPPALDEPVDLADERQEMPERLEAQVEHVKNIDVAESDDDSSLGPADASSLPSRLRFNWGSNAYGWQPAFVNRRPSGDFVISGAEVDARFVSRNFALEGPSLTPNGNLQGKLFFHRRVLHELNGYYAEHPDHGAREIKVDRIPGGVRLRIPSDGRYPTQSFEVRAKI